MTRQKRTRENSGYNSLAHTQHAINLLDTQPMQDIRHQSLETHILHTGDILGTFEILRCTIGASFSCVVDEILDMGVVVSDRSIIGRKWVGG